MNNYKLKLFYSYCHTDESYRKDMENALSLLRSNNMLKEWYDRGILAGQKISERIKKELTKSDIIIFLISPDFLHSEACIEEWNLANLLSKNEAKILISIIVRDCAWKDFDNLSDYLVLPTDGKPISHWDDKDTAWKTVYEGIRDVINNINNTFNIRPDFEKKISYLEFCSQTREEVYLDDLFVFPMLYADIDHSEQEEIIRNIDDILTKQFVIIRGDDQCGKTKLCGHIFLELSKRNKPVIFIDLDDINSKKPNLNIFSQKYSEQFTGVYEDWYKQKDKTIIFDNLSNYKNSLEHVNYAKKLYENVIVSTSNDKFNAYFKDELRLTDFSIIRIAPFTHAKQEQLIKKWKGLKNKIINEDMKIEYGQIDQMERNINEIIINNKILPRYPFFILSILQTYEAFMPQDVQITAYGHCYYALILAHLIKAGIDRKDVAIDSCFNFSSYLAFEIYTKNPGTLNINKSDFDNFVNIYKQMFIIEDSTINRLCAPHGILNVNHNSMVYFSMPYSFYFFLGRFLAKNYDKHNDIISRMVEKSYVRINTLSLIFAIHHAQDTKLIDDILLHTLCSIDIVEPSKLDENETAVFKVLLSSIPEKILTDKSIDEERIKERNHRDKVESLDSTSHDEESSHVIMNQIYKSEKNIMILSQILKNKYGSLGKDKVEEIIEIICDAGLRLISLLLCNEKEIAELTDYVEKMYLESDDYDVKKSTADKKEDIRKIITYVIFLWTMNHVEKIVSSINKPEIKDIIKAIRDKINTPAYDIIYYFYSLDAADKYEDYHKAELKKLISKYDKKEMSFLHRVLSLRTQHYINTHIIKGPLKQSVSSLLGITYKP